MGPFSHKYLLNTHQGRISKEGVQLGGWLQNFQPSGRLSMLRFACIVATKTEMEGMGFCAVFSKHRPACLVLQGCRRMWGVPVGKSGATDGSVLKCLLAVHLGTGSCGWEVHRSEQGFPLIPQVSSPLSTGCKLSGSTSAEVACSERAP